MSSSMDGLSTYNFDEAHESIQQRLSQQRKPTSYQHQPHPPASANTRSGASNRHVRTEQYVAEQYVAPYEPVVPHSHLYVPEQYPAPSLSPPPASPAPPSLPYHRKRLLEIVDPSAYDAVLADTARTVGVDLTHQPGKRWVVEALFLAPLPHNVLRCYDEMGRAYYFDKNTNSSSWQHPCAKQFESLLAAQPDQLPDDKQQQHQEESKRNEIPELESRAQPSKDAKPERHTKRFMRANQGLDASSPLFLSEAELARWDTGNEPGLDESADDEDGEEGDDEDLMKPTREMGEWLDDEFGGRDGERWQGEDRADFEFQPEVNNDVQEDFGFAQRKPFRPKSRASSMSARVSRNTSRPLSSIFPKPVLPATQVNPVPWNTKQPPNYHPWMNPAGVGDTETAVPQMGSLIGTRPVSAIPRVRPASAYGSNTMSSTMSRSAHSQAVKEGFKQTRAKINGSLRAQTSHLYTIRSTLQTKLKSLSRLRDSILVEDEHIWLGLLGSIHQSQSIIQERKDMFDLALPMLEALDARNLGDMLQAGMVESEQSLERIRTYLVGVRTLIARVQGLQNELQQQIDAIGELMKMDAHCLNLAMNGLEVDPFIPAGMSNTPLPPTSLPIIQDLLNRILEFQQLCRKYHSQVGSKKQAEKAAVEESIKESSLALRRGFQRTAEREAALVSETLANKALIPSLTNQARGIKTQLAQQMVPLGVCQRTYELRKASMDSRDENAEMMRQLEDELAALTTLVSHLESELSLTQSQVQSCMETDRMKKAEMSAEDVRLKFYKSMIGVTGSGERARAHAAQLQQEQQLKAQQMKVQQEEDTSSSYSQRSAHQPNHPSHSRSPSKTVHPVAVNEPFGDQLSFQYGKDPARVGTYLKSFDPSAQEPSFISSQPRPVVDEQQQPARPLTATHQPYGSALGGSGKPRPPTAGSRSGVRPGSATGIITTVVDDPEIRHFRNQLLRDQASNQERLRTRKVRRAKVIAGAASKPEMLIPNAGRPVFEGVHSTGYDS